MGEAKLVSFGAPFQKSRAHAIVRSIPQYPLDGRTYRILEAKFPKSLSCAKGSEGGKAGSSQNRDPAKGERVGIGRVNGKPAGNHRVVACFASGGGNPQVPTATRTGKVADFPTSDLFQRLL